jgi:large subunit ribosomal protein L21
MNYAIITVGGKQHRVREGEWLLVDRLPLQEGKTFHPDVLLIGGDGEPLVDAAELKGRQVTARVTGHLLGKKVVVGKHKQRTGYRRRNGFRARLSRIEIESIGAKPARSQAKKAEAAPAEAPARKKPGADPDTPDAKPKAAPRSRKKTEDETE